MGGGFSDRGSAVAAQQLLWKNKVRMGTCNSQEAQQDKEYHEWAQQVRASQEGGITPEYRQAQEIAKVATDTQLEAHEARKIANEAEERARQLENRARMMIHAAAEATSTAISNKEPKAMIPEGQIGEIIKAVANNSDKHIVLELFGQEDAMNPEVGTALAQALTTNTNVTVVNLSGGSVGDVGTHRLCQTLNKNRTVHSLNLRSNSISDDGAMAVADMLRTNTSLTYLNVGNMANKINATNTNTIANNGIKAICEALKVNTTLKKVVFNNLSKVDNFGAKAVMDMVAVNRGLTDVYLEGKTGISNQQREDMRQGNTTGDEEGDIFLD